MNYSETGVKKSIKRLTSGGARRIRALMVFLLCVSFLGLFSGACYGIYLGYKAAGDFIADIPDVKTIELIPDGYITQIYDDSGKNILSLSSTDMNREYVLLDRIPEDLKNAVISIEDPDFYIHEGIDPVGLLKSFVTGLLEGGNLPQTSNTITGQLLKNQLFTDVEENSFISRLNRKLREQYMALCMENRYSKNEILEFYLNTVALGQNTIGVQAAAKRYFNKDVSELGLSECATLAGIVKNPTAYNPITHTAKSRKRELQVLTAMQEEGFITSEQYEIAIVDNVQSRILRYNDTYIADQKPTTYFEDALIRSIIEDMKLELNYSETQAINSIYTGGLKIFSTVDTSLQKMCENEIENPKNYPAKTKYQLNYQLVLEHTDESVDTYSLSDIRSWYEEQGKPIKPLFSSEREIKKLISPFRRSVLKKDDRVIAESIKILPQPQTSLVLMDHSNGQVKALIGGRGDKTEELCYNRAIDATRQPGQTLGVPVAYLPAIDNAGITLGTVQDDSAYFYPNTDEQVVNQNGSYRGLTTIRDAIAGGVNVIAVKTLAAVTPRVGYDYLTDLGFTSVLDGYSDDTGNKYTDMSLSSALGILSKGVYNLELTGAYAAMANGGTYIRPHYYTRIEDHEGRTRIDHSDMSGRKVFLETSAWLVTDALRSCASADPVFSDKKDHVRSLAGISGTPEQTGDLWFVGYTPALSMGIWCGYDGGKKQKNVIYHKALLKKILNGLPDKYVSTNNFPAPDEIVSATICTKCGKLAIDDLCEEAVGGSCSRVEFYTAQSVPTDSCDCHVRCRICKESGLLAGDSCPPEDTYEAVYLQKKDEKAGDGLTMDSNLIMPEYMIDSVCNVHTKAVSDTSGKTEAEGVYSDLKELFRIQNLYDPSISFDHLFR